MNANALLLPGMTPVHGQVSSNGQFTAFPDIATLPDSQLTTDWTPVLQLITWAYLVAYLIAYVKFFLPEMLKVGQALSKRGWISRVQENNDLLYYFFGTPLLRWFAGIHAMIGACFGFNIGYCGTLGTDGHTAGGGVSLVEGLLASIPGAMVGAFAGIFGSPAIIIGFCLFVIIGTFGYGWIVIQGAFKSLIGRK